jgi:alanyl-tRNA synthetase
MIGAGVGNRPDVVQRNTSEKRGERNGMNFYQLYHSDSYLREMEAVVVGIEGNRIALDQTVFYAQSGGQPADHGTLSWTGTEARVMDVRC